MTEKEGEKLVDVVAERFEDFTVGDRGIGPKLRERLHEELDGLIARYERGDPLWLTSEVAWTSSKQNATLRLVISEQLP